MAIIEQIAATQNELTQWRRTLHARPETAFEEIWTSDFVAGKLEEFGIAIDRGMAKTAVIGNLTAGSSDRVIGLRADMDALHILEANEFSYKSVNHGKMHACGHDGHMVMLLGAARHIAETRNFDGTIRFIFQPAEENEGGARVMIEEGLFEKFPVDAIFGMHNKPGIPTGKFAIRPGPMLASYDIFEIMIKGTGTHAALPHSGTDPIVVAGQMILALQTLVRSNVHPLDAAVLSITQIHGGDTWNVIPDTVVLGGTTRFYKKEVQDRMEDAIRSTAERLGAAFDTSVSLRYERRYPPLINSERETEFAASIAEQTVGKENVNRDPEPAMSAEDFAFMLQQRPGAYINVGNGPGEGGCYLHNPNYDFNDEALVYGASYWVNLVETYLAPRI